MDLYRTISPWHAVLNKQVTECEKGDHRVRLIRRLERDVGSTQKSQQRLFTEDRGNEGRLQLPPPIPSEQTSHMNELSVRLHYSKVLKNPPFTHWIPLTEMLALHTISSRTRGHSPVGRAVAEYMGSPGLCPQHCINLVWWHAPTIPALERQIQKIKHKMNLGYIAS